MAEDGDGLACTRPAMTTDSGTLRRTALYDAHLALGARIVPFGGFEMPVQYSSILKEHDAVRKAAGLFDLSHMAQIAITGTDVGAWAESLTVNKVANMKPGQARYNIFTNERGGAHDDVIFYRLADERWLLVVNAGNADKMWAHVQAQRAGDVQLTNLHGERALIAIQGPRSVELAAALRRRRPGRDEVLLVRRGRTCAAAASRSARAHRLHRRGRLRAVPALGGRDRPVGRCCSPRTASGVWSRAAWARATCCGWRPGCRSTATS